MKLAIVLWADAYFTHEDDDRPHLPRVSTGWLVANNKKTVKLALTYDEAGSDDILTIPKPYVLHMEIIRTISARDVKKMLAAAEGDRKKRKPTPQAPQVPQVGGPEASEAPPQSLEKPAQSPDRP